MSADGDVTPTPLELQQFITGQTAGFYAFLHHAVNEYGETGKLPAAVFSATGKTPRVKGGKKEKDPSKPKRSMTAFNFYVQKRISELRDNGFTPEADPTGKSRGMLGQAVKDWKSMSEAAREAFVADFKRTHGPGAEQPATPVAAVTGDELPKKKKKKKHKHKEGADLNGLEKPKKKKKKHREHAEE